MADESAAVETDGVDPIDAFTSAMKVVSRHGSTERDAEDQAAAIAVLREVLIEEAEQRHDASQGVDHWAASARGLRAPLSVGPGQWRGFSG